MSKPAELIALAESLEAHSPSPASPVAKRLAHDAVGMDSEIATCPLHGIPYARLYVRSSDFWTGQCAECKADADIGRQAGELLAGRLGEIRTKVEALLPDYEGQVQAQVKTEVEAYAASVRPQFEADVRKRLWDQLQGQIEAELLAEIIRQLKGDRNGK